MLNIVKSKFNLKHFSPHKENKSIPILYKHFSPRDWNSSIYGYNKNSVNLIPVANSTVNKLIYSYFNSYNKKLDRSLRKTELSKRKLSTNKIFVSSSEFKHTNDNVLVTLYIYNRQKYNYLFKLTNRYRRFFVKRNFIEMLLKIKSESVKILNDQQEQRQNLGYVLPRYQSNLFLIQHQYYKKYLKLALKRLRLFMLYKQLLYVNETKFTNSYLQGLIFLIKKIYNKNIEFNIINLKYFYFNSDIFSQLLVLKLAKKRKLLKFLKDCVAKVNIMNIDSDIKLKNNTLDPYASNKDQGFNNLLYDLLRENGKDRDLKNVILDRIKYKRVSGVRLGASGRLTKRYTASRSMNKVLYKGSLANTLSSVKHYPSVVLRGNFKPNLQCTKLYSKSRIGTFGVKGWISGR